MPEESHLCHLKYDNDDPGEDEDKCQLCGGTGWVPAMDLSGKPITYSKHLFMICPEDCWRKGI